MRSVRATRVGWCIAGGRVRACLEAFKRSSLVLGPAPCRGGGRTEGTVCERGGPRSPSVWASQADHPAFVPDVSALSERTCLATNVASWKANSR